MPKRPEISDLSAQPKPPEKQGKESRLSASEMSDLLDWGDRAQRIIAGAGYRHQADQWDLLRRLLE